MGSTSVRPHGITSVDDRTARARIRDSAIVCFAEYGVADTTVRKIASAAEVSPGLVIHHFGSMEGLRSACDEHVAAAIRQVKEGAMSAGPELDVFSVMRETNIGSAAAYLARVLTDDSPTVTGLIDDLIADAEDYLQRGVESGMLRPSVDPRGRAVVLVLWSLGVLVLHDHLERLLGVDLTDPDLGASPTIASYLEPAYEILGGGVFANTFMDHLHDTLVSEDDETSDVEVTVPPAAETSSTTETKGT